MYPLELAVTVACPSKTPVTVNVPLLAPAAIVTVSGIKLTAPLGVTARVTTVPPTGAGTLKVTVPLMVRVIPTPGALRATVMVGVTTVTTKLAG